MADNNGRNFANILDDLSNSLKSTKNPAYFINTLIQCIPLLSTIRVCLEAGIFDVVIQSDHPITAEDIARQIHSDDGAEAQGDRRDFVIRMLRGVGAFGLIDETAPFTYQANDITRVIATPAFAGGFKLVYDDNMGPRSIMTEMVNYHKARGWRGPDSGEDGPYQRAHDVVGMSSFHHWAEYNPVQASRLSNLMQVAQKHRLHYFTWYPKEELFAGAGSDEWVYVDVGGGRGHDVRALAQKYRGEKARYVLQDLPNVVEETRKSFAEDNPSDNAQIKIMAHDFFQPQPIKGANVYFLHKIMHDWPDKDCCRILERLRDAMGPHSRILLCDFILPNQGSSVLQSAFDIDMMALHSGAERDEGMWERLIQKVDGLKLRKLWQPPGGEAEGVVEVVKAD